MQSQCGGTDAALQSTTRFAPLAAVMVKPADSAVGHAAPHQRCDATLTYCSATHGCRQWQEAPDGAAVFGGGALCTVEYDDDLFQGLIKMHNV